MQDARAPPPAYRGPHDSLQGLPHYPKCMEAFISFLCILLLPLWVIFLACLIPFQEPQNGIRNNWGWIIHVSICVACTLWVYVHWNQMYLSRAFYVPILLTTASACGAMALVSEYCMPLKACGIVLLFLVIAFYNPALFLCAWGAGMLRSPLFRRNAERFMVVQVFWLLIGLVSWAYIVLVFVLPAHQFIVSACYWLFMAAAKCAGVLYTSCTLANKANHGVIAFNVELFYSMFVALCFASLDRPWVASIILLSQISSAAFGIFLLTDRGYLAALSVEERLGVATVLQHSPQALTAHPPAASFGDPPEACAIPSPPLSPSSSSPLSSSPSLDLSPSLSSSLSPSPAFSQCTVPDAYIELVLRVCALSMFAHFIVPFYTVPIIAYLRFGWNGSYFPYAALSPSAFHNSLLLSGTALGLAVVSWGAASTILTRMRRSHPRVPTLMRLLLPDLVTHKNLFMSMIVSVAATSLVAMPYQAQVVYLFVHRDGS